MTDEQARQAGQDLAKVLEMFDKRIKDLEEKVKQLVKSDE